jgi:alkylhydroperoxidase family enzyme
MIRWLINWKLDGVERQLGQPVDYLRHMVKVSLRAFFKFVRIIPLAEYRRVLPVDACHVARLIASREADCGTCLQIAINMARKSGVGADVLRAVVERRVEDLPAELADVYRFAEAVVANRADLDALRTPVRQAYGDEGLIEIALAIASSQVFPITKRAMGFATCCANVRLAI